MKKLRCSGGPYEGHYLKLSASVRTLEFKAKGMEGYYKRHRCPSYPPKDEVWEWVRTGDSKAQADLNYIFCR